MKIFAILFMSLPLAVSAETIQGKRHDDVPVTQVESYAGIPSTPESALSGRVVGVYGGSACGVSTYHVVVSNTDAQCTGDDCLATQVYELHGFRGTPQVFYRKVDANTHSIAVIGERLESVEDSCTWVRKKALLRVTFNDSQDEESDNFGINKAAQLEIVNP